MSERNWMFYTESKDGKVSITDNVTYQESRKLYNDASVRMEELNLDRVGHSEITDDVFSQQILRKKAGLSSV